MRESLLSLLEAGASGAPERLALLDVHGRTVTYNALVRRVLDSADSLAARGVRRGDKVAWMIPNGSEAAESLLAITSVATAVPIPPTATFDEVRGLLEKLKIHSVVTLNGSRSEATDAAESLHIPIIPFKSVSEPSVPPGTGTRTGIQNPGWSRPQPSDVALLLPRGGTDRAVRQIPLTHRNLISAAHQMVRTLSLQPSDRCLNVSPMQSLHGVVGCLLASLASGSGLICTPELDPAQVPHWLSRFEATWYSATPAAHQSILERFSTSLEPTPAHRLRFVRSCSSALPARLLRELEQTLRVPVIESYSLSEASHLVASNPLPPRIRKPGSVGIAAGVKIAVLDESGVPLPPGQSGEIAIQGDGITPGYSAPGESVRRPFVGGWYRTGDQGWLDAEGYLYLSGRLDEVIKRGTDRIVPRDVDAMLMTHPSVAQAIAFPRPHPTLGEDLAAAVILREGASATENGLRAFAFDRLASAQVPSTVLILDHFPTGTHGRVQRKSLASRLSGHFRARHVPPRDDIEALVADIWEDVLEVRSIGIHDNLFVLGGDTVRGVRIISRINDLFQLALPVTALFRHPTVGQFTDELKRLSHPALLETIAQNVRDLGTLSQQDVLELLSSTGRPS